MVTIMDTVYQLIDLLGRPLGILVTFFLVVFFVIRPGMQLLVNMLAARRRRQLELERQTEQAAKEEELLELLRQAGPDLTDRDRIERLAKSNPDRAIELVRAWLHKQGA